MTLRIIRVMIMLEKHNHLNKKKVWICRFLDAFLHLNVNDYSLTDLGENNNNFATAADCSDTRA